MSKNAWIIAILLLTALWMLFSIKKVCEAKGKCVQKPAPVAEVVKPKPVQKPVVQEIAKPKPAPVAQPAPVVEPEPVVKEVVKPFVCTDYLQGTLKLGRSGNTSVDATKVEEFLNKYEGASLTVDGVYGAADELAVRKFQAKYKTTVLVPLGLAGPTGHVLGYTRAQINKLYCQYKQAELAQ